MRNTLSQFSSSQYNPNIIHELIKKIEKDINYLKSNPIFRQDTRVWFCKRTILFQIKKGCHFKLKDPRNQIILILKIDIMQYLLNQNESVEFIILRYGCIRYYSSCILLDNVRRDSFVNHPLKAKSWR